MRTYKRALCFLMALAMSAALTACGGPSADYPDAASFEAALNSGENLEGKTVQFTATDVIPNSALGYNIQAGENLNFISSTNPDVKKGDVVTVKADTIVSLFGIWLIRYEKLSSSAGSPSSSEAAASDRNTPSQRGSTGSSSSTYPGTPSFTPAPSDPAETPQPLELVDYGWYIGDSSRDPAHVDFCGMIYNPNENLISRFPKIIVTVKNGDGSILATNSQTGGDIMPGDTVTICGTISVPMADVTEDAVIGFDVEWSRWEKDTSRYSSAKTTDFEITNITERSNGSKNFITGEITNNYPEDVDMVNLSVIFRKNGEIVYIDRTYLDNLRTGKPKAFEITSYHDWPEHDTIDISAMVW